MAGIPRRSWLALTNATLLAGGAGPALGQGQRQRQGRPAEPTTFSLSAESDTLRDRGAVNFWLRRSGAPIAPGRKATLRIGLGGGATDADLRQPAPALIFQSLALTRGVAVDARAGTVTIGPEAPEVLSWALIGRTLSAEDAAATLVTTLSDPEGCRLGTASHTLRIEHAPVPIPKPAFAWDADRLGDRNTLDAEGRITRYTDPASGRVATARPGTAGPRPVTVDGVRYLRVRGSSMRCVDPALLALLGKVPRDYTILVAGRLRAAGDAVLLDVGTPDSNPSPGTRSFALATAGERRAGLNLRFRSHFGQLTPTPDVTPGEEHVWTAQMPADERAAGMRLDDGPSLGVEGWMSRERSDFSVGAVDFFAGLAGGNPCDADLRAFELYVPSLDEIQLQARQRALLARIGRRETRPASIDAMLAGTELRFADDFDEMLFGNVDFAEQTRDGRPALWQSVVKGMTERDARGDNTGKYYYVINREEQYYGEPGRGVDPFSLPMPSVLGITASRASVTGANPLGKPYNSGHICTRRASIEQRLLHGFFEVRARQPTGLSPAEAQGLWPAFWDMPVGYDNSNEIDMVESVNVIRDATNMGWIQGIAQNYSEKQGGGGFTGLADLSDGKFHNHGRLWDANGNIWFTCDGVIVRHGVIGAQFIWLYNQIYRSLILNMAIGGTFPGDPTPATKLPQTLLIDWVRYWCDDRAVGTIVHGRIGGWNPASRWLAEVPPARVGIQLPFPYEVLNATRGSLTVQLQKGGVTDGKVQLAPEGPAVLLGNTSGVLSVRPLTTGRHVVQILDNNDNGKVVAESRYFTVT
ncbi:glycoside hydrolase family 16 protein [Roseomonas sp. NAR14]|uniref:Glycoside hydrolase family 16 protein n=1 Tax=Roseomonas acroporae TaxID=2937791 RepID=A0A9X1YCK9_9PROT|nr:glycoside hydrolase family 16 protein [Roseomonas acroporae]MCK8783991.1 glycoside hydrolase family 16 protein [Roseomonas acroporae]